MNQPNPMDQAQADLAGIAREIEALEQKGGLTADQLELLMDDLPSFRVSSRTQGGSKLSYVEAHDIKNMMIRIFGFGNFSSDVLDAKIIDIDRDWKNSKGAPGVQISAMSSVRISVGGQTYTESAVSVQSGTQGLGDVADFAIKTASSDAFKRAAIFLGTQFGLSLYADGSTVDQVQILLEPRQKRLLELARARKQIQQWIWSQPLAGAPIAPQNGQSPQNVGPTPQTGAEQPAQNPMQAAFNQGQS